MKTIEGISFTEASAALVQELIDVVRSKGECIVYPLLEMEEKGQLRIALHKELDRDAIDAFAFISPRAKGAFYHVPKEERAQTYVDWHQGRATVALTYDNLPHIIKSIELQRQSRVHSENQRRKKKESEVADPNQPGTVSAGQVESNRRKH